MYDLLVENSPLYYTNVRKKHMIVQEFSKSQNWDRG